MLMKYAKVVDPARNTASYIFILIAYINAYNKSNKIISDADLFQKISKFLKSFDGRQIRYLGKEFHKVVDALVQMVVGVRQVSLWARNLRYLCFNREIKDSILDLISRISRRIRISRSRLKLVAYNKHSFSVNTDSSTSASFTIALELFLFPLGAWNFPIVCAHF